MNKEFTVQILGSNSALPFHNRFPSAQYIKYGKFCFLVDCGEGSQSRLQEYSLSPYPINAIFISHLHGDHIFGLPGILTTLSLNNRKKELDIYAPYGVKDFIQVIIDVTQSKVNFPLNIHELDCSTAKTIYNSAHLNVTSIPLDHRIPTIGYLFREHNLDYNLDKEKLKETDIPISAFPELKKGNDVVLENGEILRYQEFTLPPRHERSYAYLTDTRYKQDNVKLLEGVDLLYHDATFMGELKEKAERTGHSTAREAAVFALKANVGTLLLGHFSSRYRDLRPLLQEARSIFKNSELAIDGSMWEIE